MKFELATEKDSQDLINFFQKHPFPGPVEVSISRTHPFFDFYKITSDDFDPYVLRDDEGKVAGLVTLIYRETWLNGKIEKIGYMTDLRIEPQREALLSWSKSFLDIIDESKEKRNCRYLFTVLSQEQGKAYNTFLRARSPKRKMPRYYLLRKFDYITLHGRVPFFSRPLSTLNISSASKSDLAELLNYLNIKLRERPLGFVLNDENDLMTHLGRFKNLSLSDFLLARDNDGNIVGCVAPWDASPVQKYKVTEYHGYIAGLRQFLKVGSLIGMAKKLPERNQALRFKFLSHLLCDNPDVFQSLLYYAYKQTKGAEFLTYINFHEDYTTNVPKHFLAGSLPFGVYTLWNEDEPLPECLLPTPMLPPPFLEAALI